MVRSAAVAVAALILPTFAQAQEPQGTHEVVRGNTLWDLAAFYYEDPFQWRVIWDANREVVEDPNWIYPAEVLVIPGLPGAAVGPEGEPVVEGVEPAEGEPADPPVSPEIEDVPPDLIPFGFRRARPADQARSIFYNDPTAAAERAVRVRDVEYVAVSRDAAYSAPWLGPLEGDPEHAGVIEGFAEGSGRATTIRSYDLVRVAMPAPARVGAQLQIFRVTASIDLVGQVVSPTGILTVSTIGEGYVVGRVEKEYGRIVPGDFVGPLPTYDPQAGAYAEDVPAADSDVAMIMGFQGRQVLSDIGHIAFLDLGRADDVSIGDEFVLYGDAVPTARRGILQVVGVSERTSAARILAMSDDVFHQGVAVQRAKKMR